MDGKAHGPPVPRVLVCDLGGVERADIGTVDALCRIALNARRLGLTTRLCNASPALCELLELAGVDALVGCDE